MISILLASYNGEKYIAEQIDSLLSQSCQDFKLYIYDDCSTDNTYSLITEYAVNHPDKIIPARNQANSGGAGQNFINMMIAHNDDYIMLCDHDDIWLPGKVEITLAKMKDMEHKFGVSTPILVHTDLRVVNEKLQTISPSFKAAMNADFKKTKLQNQIIQNTLTGCTVMYNRALSELITETPRYMIMHDWWLMLVASAFGVITDIEVQTVLYRQHSANEIGAKDVRTLRYKVNKLLSYTEIRRALNETYEQAQSFLDAYKNKLTREQIELLHAYCDIPNHVKLVRWLTICRLGVLKNGLARKLANFIFI